MGAEQDDAHNAQAGAEASAAPFPSEQSYRVSMRNGAEPWSLAPLPLSILTAHGVLLAQPAAEGERKCMPDTSLKERDYMGLASVEAPPSAAAHASGYSDGPAEKEIGLAMDSKETELRLGIGPPRAAADISKETQDAVDEECEASVAQRREAGVGNAMSFYPQEKTEPRSANLGFLRGSNANEVYHVAPEAATQEKKHFGHGYELPSPPADVLPLAAAAAPAATQICWPSQIFRSSFRPPPNQDVANAPDRDAPNWGSSGLYGAARLVTQQPKNTIPAKRGFLEALCSMNRNSVALTDSVGDMVGKIQGTQGGVTIAEGPTTHTGMIYHSPSLLFPVWGNATGVAAGWKVGVEQTKGGCGATTRPVNPAPGSTPQAPPMVQTGNREAPSDSSHDFQQKDAGSASPRAPVVGWPPVRSFRKSTLSSQAKPVSVAAPVDDPEPPTTSVSKLFVKANMDGVPIGRKVDLKAYNSYESLKVALQDMFQQFLNGYTAGQGSSAAEIKSLDLLHGSDYVLTYEDNVGDWMLVGDVPWEMFVSGVKRLRITMSSNAAGLGQKSAMKPK